VDRTKGVKGITAFLVPDDVEGLVRGKIENKMGFNSSHTGMFTLEEVKIPRKNLLGEEGKGFGIAMKMLDVLRIVSCGAVGVGVARAAKETTLNFIKEHPKAKEIMTQQAIGFDLADMSAMVEAARLMVWKSSWLIDQNKKAGEMSSLTKFYASDVALRVANMAVQLIGLPSYGEIYPVEKLVRDAKLLQIYEGTNQISRMVASRNILLK
jgi:alkylation response protein AidB-like acyl-CoA dehydrogenase